MQKSSNAQFFLLEQGGWSKIPEQEAMTLSPRQLCNGPTLIRFYLNGQPQYFVGNDEAYFQLQEKGIQTRWIHDLFEQWRQSLVAKGLLPTTKVYDWSMDYFHMVQATLETFLGTRETNEHKAIFQA